MKPTKLGEFDVTILDPKIVIFHNIIDNPEGYIEYYEEEGDWRGWYGFGRQIDASGPHIRDMDHFPSAEEWESLVNEDDSDPLRNKLGLKFRAASEEYMKYSETVLPNWTSPVWALARYISDENVINSDDLTMNYHTDYQADRHDHPGEKFAVTAVFYPNDDYEGGEISFRIINENNEIASEIDYKPKKGDLVFFPAMHPYYHGVRRIWKKPKYIVRFYWTYTYEGSPEFFKWKEKYGDKFQELEQERLRRHDLMIMTPYMRPSMTLDEYYMHLEAGTLPPKRV